jgi:MYXO-CTERM domain-containing protein
MLRTSFVALVALATAAVAGPFAPGTRLGSHRVAVVTPTEAFTPMTAPVTPIIYVNRCVGGCPVMGGTVNDAQAHTATLIAPGPHVLTEFQNDQLCGSACTGAAADAQWAQLMQCMREVYSPFQITITDIKPTSGYYTEIMVAGQPEDVGLDAGILGIAPVHSDCDPHDNAIAFAFANHDVQTDHVFNVCWTAAQESAHNFGLDHEYEFYDGQSACNDPMTYRYDCGGEKFFRNKGAKCGEDAPRACTCPDQTQNSHAKLLATFGPGTPITTPPMVAITAPVANQTIAASAAIHAMGSAQRGITKVEFYLNGHKWGEDKGATFGAEGQFPSDYAFTIPANVPNSVIDIQAKAYDDLNIETDSTVVTVTKGAPCSSADTCLKGQKCEQGKCFWDAPAGQIGDTCTYNEFCVDGVCAGTDSSQICTKNCILGSTDSCPTGYDCIDAGGGQAVCYPPSNGGCCSVERDGSRGVWVHVGLGAAVLGLLARRRRRA